MRGRNTHLVGGFKHFLFSISYMGLSLPLTNSIIFQRGRSTTNQSWSWWFGGWMLMEKFCDSIASQQRDLRRTDEISARIRATFWIQSQPVACCSLIRGFVARCKFLKNIQKPSVPFNFFKVYINAIKHIGNLWKIKIDESINCLLRFAQLTGSFSSVPFVGVSSKFSN